MGWVGRGEAGRVRRLCRPGEGAARGQMVQNMESCMVLNVMAIIPWLKMMTCLDLVAGTCVAGVFSQGLGMIIQSSGDHHVLLFVHKSPKCSEFESHKMFLFFKFCSRIKNCSSISKNDQVSKKKSIGCPIFKK